MTKLEMFENLPEGFRLATDDPTEMKLAALTIGQAFAEHPYPLPSTERPFDARLKPRYAMGEGYVKNAFGHGCIPTNEDKKITDEENDSTCWYMLRRCNA